MTWRFAASTGCCVNCPVSSTLQAFHEGGVRAVEIGTPPGHFDPWRHDQVAALAECLHELGIAPIAIHAPFGGTLELSDPNPHHRHAALGAILSAASALREVGGSSIVVHLSDVPRNPHEVDERLAQAAASLRVLARACRHMEVRLLVETPLPHLVGGHPDEFAAVIRQLDHRVSACFDTSHATLGGNWDRFMGLAGDRLVHVHANDHRGRFDDHLPPGEGIIDWRHIRETLASVGFDGWIVLELACPVNPLAEYVGLALRRARELFADRVEV